MMNAEQLRDYCLSLPGVTEKMPFQHFAAGMNLLAFYVDGHIFCFFDIVKFDECTVRSLPADIAELKARYTAIGKLYNFSPADWIGIRFGGDVDDTTLKRLIAASQQIVASASHH